MQPNLEPGGGRQEGKKNPVESIKTDLLAMLKSMPAVDKEKPIMVELLPTSSPEVRFNLKVSVDDTGKGIYSQRVGVIVAIINKDGVFAPEVKDVKVVESLHMMDQFSTSNRPELKTKAESAAAARQDLQSKITSIFDPELRTKLHATEGSLRDRIEDNNETEAFPPKRKAESRETGMENVFETQKPPSRIIRGSKERVEQPALTSVPEPEQEEIPTEEDQAKAEALYQYAKNLHDQTPQSDEFVFQPETAITNPEPKTKKVQRPEFKMGKTETSQEVVERTRNEFLEIKGRKKPEKGTPEAVRYEAELKLKQKAYLEAENRLIREKIK